MKKSKNYSLNLPEPDDYVIIGDLNSNTVELDKLIKLINDDLAVLSTDGVSLKEILTKKADLGDTGKIPEKQLPDLDVYKDVLMYEAKGNFPAKGKDRKLYVDKATGRIYRWTGSEYTEVSNALDLGETSKTAYRGDRGKIAYDHSLSAHAPADALSREESYSRAEVDEKVKKSETTLTTQINATQEIKKTYGSGYSAYKCGRVVTLYFNGVPRESTLPYGFRPMSMISAEFVLGNTNSSGYIPKNRLSISTDGRVSFSSSMDRPDSIYYVTTYITER